MWPIKYPTSVKPECLVLGTPWTICSKFILNMRDKLVVKWVNKLGHELQFIVRDGWTIVIKFGYRPLPKLRETRRTHLPPSLSLFDIQLMFCF